MVDTEKQIADAQIFAHRVEQPVLTKAAEFTVEWSRLGSETEMFGYRLATDRDLAFGAKNLSSVFLTLLQAVCWSIRAFLAMAFGVYPFGIHSLLPRNYPRFSRVVKRANLYCYFSIF